MDNMTVTYNSERLGNPITTDETEMKKAKTRVMLFTLLGIICIIPGLIALAKEIYWVTIICSVLFVVFTAIAIYTWVKRWDFNIIIYENGFQYKNTLYYCDEIQWAKLTIESSVARNWKVTNIYGIRVMFNDGKTVDFPNNFNIKKLLTSKDLMRDGMITNGYGA